MAARFSLVIADSRTGIVLDADGSWHTGGPRFEPRFETLDAALAEKDRLLAAFEAAEVMVTDGTGVVPAVVYTRAGMRPASP